MANMAILDTGFLNILNEGTQAPDIANSGTAIDLKTVDVTYQTGGNIDDSPIINDNAQANLNFGSISNAKITLSGILDRNVTADMDLMNELVELRRTYGIKLLYYTDSTDGFREITDSIGSTDTAHLSGTIPHLHVRVGNVTFRDISTSIVRYSIEMVETA